MNKIETQWPHAIPGRLIQSNEIHVWRMILDLNVLQRESLLGILSDDEVARAGRFYFKRDRNRYIVARGMLRQILGHYLGEKPDELQFEYTFYGKPILATDHGFDTLSFNLSHSGEFALCAVTRQRNIGIDIERIREDIIVDQVARRFFSQGEISSLVAMDKNNQGAVFFQYWTRKEAFIKAMGKGVSFPLEQCDVSLMTGNVLSPITLLGDHDENLDWFGQDLFPVTGYAAAIAVEGSDWDISCWHYSAGVNGVFSG